jgi:riboflavin synthase
MFTGIVEDKGKVAELADSGRVLLVTSGILTEVPVGGSVAVNGTCLTVVETTPSGAKFDVVPETLSRTNLGSLEVGDLVNLERAMPATGRFDGHFVQGHVDGTGQVTALDEDQGSVTLRISAAAEILEQVVEKGSITIDGVSLTVAAVSDAGFEVALIPHTLEVTTLGSLAEGDTVNLETDILAKYVQRIGGRT